MIKWLLGGSLFTLGLIKLYELMKYDSSVGMPLFWTLFIVWAYQALKTWNGSRR